VLIQANIDRSGNVSKTEIILSSKYEILDKAAIRCVRKARFAPASYMGNPAPDTLRIAVNFNLN
jgi:TonB family protein